MGLLWEPKRDQGNLWSETTVGPLGNRVRECREGNRDCVRNRYDGEKKPRLHWGNHHPGEQNSHQPARETGRTRRPNPINGQSKGITEGPRQFRIRKHSGSFRKQSKRTSGKVTEIVLETDILGKETNPPLRKSLSRWTKQSPNSQRNWKNQKAKFGKWTV